jgi:hypothetical protein
VTEEGLVLPRATDEWLTRGAKARLLETKRQPQAWRNKGRGGDASDVDADVPVLAVPAEAWLRDLRPGQTVGVAGTVRGVNFWNDTANRNYAFAVSLRDVRLSP